MNLGRIEQKDSVEKHNFIPLFFFISFDKVHRTAFSFSTDCEISGLALLDSNTYVFTTFYLHRRFFFLQKSSNKLFIYYALHPPVIISASLHCT